MEYTKLLGFCGDRKLGGVPNPKSVMVTIFAIALLATLMLV